MIDTVAVARPDRRTGEQFALPHDSNIKIAKDKKTFTAIKNYFVLSLFYWTYSDPFVSQMMGFFQEDYIQ